LATAGPGTLLELPQNFAEVAGKETIEVAAEKAGFGNKETYRQAKAVTEHATLELGKAVEAELGKRQGQRTDLATAGQGTLLELPANWPEVAGKETRELAAKKAGFDSEATYRRAKSVTEHATPELGKAVEAELKEAGERRGRPKQDNEQQNELLEISQNFGELSGKKNYEVAAEKAGFNNPETYRQAKSVTEHATPELVEAMDQGKVAISTAATSPRVNRQWLRRWRIPINNRARKALRY